MRRATIVTVRTMIVLLLAAAAADVKIPGRSRDRVRIHLVDRSASTDVPGPAESLLPKDADDIIARDLQTRSGGDVVAWASFGRTTAFESRTVDGSATDLAGFARAAVERTSGAALNDFIRSIADGGDGARLDFRAADNYDDYIFWMYNLTLAQNPRG